MNDINELRQVIEAKAFHPFLQKYIEKPLIDEDKVLLLWGLFNEVEISRDERNHYMLSTMLVQMALDTHEQVSTTKVELECLGVLKSQQLTVLAGDYYSGLYYQVLAEVGNVDMIYALSNAVKKMNDHKILLYQGSLTNLTTFVNSVKVVEASLLHKLAEYYQKPIWMNASENILLLKRLYHEKKQYMSTGQSILFECLRMMLFPEVNRETSLSKEQTEKMENMMDICIEKAIQSVKHSKDELPLAHVDLHRRIENMLVLTNLQAKIHM